MSNTTWHPVDGYPGLARRNDPEDGVLYLRRQSLETRNLKQGLALYMEANGERRENSGTITVKKAWPLYIEARRSYRKGGTVDKDEDNWKYLKPILGHRKVKDVGPEHCEAVMQAVAKQISKKTGKPLAKNTRRTVQFTMSNFFRWCIEHPQGYRDDNPVKRMRQSIRIGAVERRSHAKLNLIVTNDEIDRLVAACVPGRNNSTSRVEALQTRTILTLLPLTGLRIGEMCGLELRHWTHIEGKATSKLVIEQQLTEKREIEGLKGEDTTIGDKRRTLHLAEGGKAHETLCAYVEQGLTEGWLKLDGFLFPSLRDGRPRRTNSVQNRLVDLRREIGIGREISCHWFRHTYASNAINKYLDAGQPVNWDLIASQLGHDVKMTQEIYGHMATSLAYELEAASLASR